MAAGVAAGTSHPCGIPAASLHGLYIRHVPARICQNTSDAYQQTWKRLGLECSMSRTRCCWDNAVMERFFWLLKHEWTNHETYANLAEVRCGVFRYIEAFYNSVRKHRTLGYLSPNNYEAEHAPVLAA